MTQSEVVKKVSEILDDPDNRFFEKSAIEDALQDRLNEHYMIIRHLIPAPRTYAFRGPKFIVNFKETLPQLFEGYNFRNRLTNKVLERTTIKELHRLGYWLDHEGSTTHYVLLGVNMVLFYPRSDDLIVLTGTLKPLKMLISGVHYPKVYFGVAADMLAQSEEWERSARYEARYQEYLSDLKRLDILESDRMTFYGYPE